MTWLWALGGAITTAALAIFAWLASQIYEFSEELAEEFSDD